MMKNNQYAEQRHELATVDYLPTGYCHNCASYAKRSTSKPEPLKTKMKLLTVYITM